MFQKSVLNRGLYEVQNFDSKIMGYAVYHTEKGKASGGGIGHHIDRTPGREYSYSHADPNRKDLNVSFQVHKDREKTLLHNAISERIAEGYKGKRKIRNDAVRYLNHVLTGSHEDMKQIFDDKDKSQKWLNENYKFACQEFGHENIVRFTLHLDEKTPHIHCVTVPLTEEGKLSAKEIMGNKKVLRERQDKYADMMKSFGLDRGIGGTGIKHETQQQYYKRIEDAKKEAENMEIKLVKGLFGVKKDKTIEKLQKDLKSLKMAFNELNTKAKVKEIKFDTIKNGQFGNMQKLSKAEDEISRLHKVFKEIILSPNRTEELREEYQEQEQQSKQKYKPRF